MSALKHIIKKEFRQISRNKVMIPLLFVMPILQMIVLSYAADFDLKNVQMAVVDLDQSVSSRSLIQKFTASGYFTLTNSFHSQNEAMEALDKETADLVLNIPKETEADLKNGKPVNVQLLLNAVNNQKASLASNYAQQVINGWNLERVKTLGMGSSPLLIDIRESYWYNPELNYKTFMVPGILAVLVTFLTAMLSSINIIREREMGTIEQLNVTPITKMEFIIGKIVPFWIIGMFLMAFGLTVARLIFGIGVAGSFFTLFSFVAIYIITILGIGILISTVTETQQQAMFVTWFFMVIFLLLSGLFTPVDSIPDWAKAINVMNPIKYFVEVMRMIMLKGSGFTDLKHHFMMMGIFAVFYNILAVFKYRKTTG